MPANTITGLEPGEVFVHRNVANLVHPSDLNLPSVLEYAIDVLEVSHVIVCGHYGCGGIRAALDGERHGIIDHWLQPIRDVAEQNQEELDRLPDLATRLNRVCEMSTRNQVARLEQTPIVQWAWKRGKRVRIHGWVYRRTALRSQMQRAVSTGGDRRPDAQEAGVSSAPVKWKSTETPTEFGASSEGFGRRLKGADFPDVRVPSANAAGSRNP